MTKEEVKAVLVTLWEAKYIIAGTMVITGILDLIGITTHDLGLGFIIGFLILFILAGVYMIKPNIKKKM